MARTLPTPRKRRTREHVIADQNLNYLERFIIDAWQTVQRCERDYGYDLFMFTYDEEGYAEPGSVNLQLKAAENLELSGNAYVYDLDIRDYHLWMLETMPVVLVLFDASRRRAYWLYVQRYFRGAASRQPKKGAKTVRVRVPRRQAVTRRGILRIRSFKQALFEQLEGAIDHG